MAALLPILQEILPMLMPGPVQIVRAEDVGRGDDDAGEDDDEKGQDEREGDDESHEREGEQERKEDGGEGQKGREGDGESHEREGGQEGQDGQDQDTTQRPTARRTDDRPRRPRPSGGVFLRDAVVHKSSTLCASVLTVQPGCATVVFHNGEQDALVYAVSGTAVLATLPEDIDDDDDDASRSSKAADPTTHAVRPGDFALIPAWTEHQVRNVGVAGADGRPPADVVWVVVRNGAEPTVVPLRAWGGEQMDDV